MLNFIAIDLRLYSRLCESFFGTQCILLALLRCKVNKMYGCCKLKSFCLSRLLFCFVTVSKDDRVRNVRA